MNKKKLEKSLYHRVGLRPPAKQSTGANPFKIIDDDWIIENVDDNGIRLSNPRTGHSVLLGLDHIHHYISNPQRGWDGLKYGFLELNVQLELVGNEIKIEPSNIIHM